MDIVERANKHIYPNYDDISPETGEIIRELIAEVEKLREEDCDFPHITILNENSALKAENAELKEECEKLHKYCQGRYKFDPIKNEQTIKDLKAKLADKSGTVDKLAEMLREREGNMDGLVQKLRKQLHANNLKLEASEKRIKHCRDYHKGYIGQ